MSLEKILTTLHWPFLRRMGWAQSAGQGRIRPGAIRRKAGGVWIGDPINYQLKSDEEWFASAFREARELKTCGNVEFERSAEGGILARTPKFKVIVSRPEHLQMLVHLLLNCEYKFQVSGSYLILDIGANVGFASLDFAANHNCPVIAFELLESTCDLAVSNFNLNPELQKRITIHPFGLSDDNREIAIRYDPSHLWSTSSVSDNLLGGTAMADAVVNVRSAAAELTQIIADHPGCKLILKMDCEGAEYEILAQLREQGLLKQVQIVFLEWHRLNPEHDPEALLQQLVESGFAITFRQSLRGTAGVVTAIRTYRDTKLSDVENSVRRHQSE